jgi:hypothetical protein
MTAELLLCGVLLLLIATIHSCASLCLPDCTCGPYQNFLQHATPPEHFYHCVWFLSWATFMSWRAAIAYFRDSPQPSAQPRSRCRSLKTL